MPEVYIAGIQKKFDDNGELSDESTRKILEEFIGAYAAWVEHNAIAS